MLDGKRIVAVVAILLLFTLAACGSSSGTAQSKSTVVRTQSVIGTPTQVVATTTVPHVPAAPAGSKPITATPTQQNTAPNGPTIILTPTPVPGGGAGSQEVTLADRMLLIQSVTEQTGETSHATAITLMLTIHNTSAKPILNEATFFQLVGSQGDMFGYQSSATASFFGTISPQSSRNGTIVFQVPTGAMSGGLRLLFRSEIDAETVFVRLQIS